jgi:hypothetical protein
MRRLWENLTATQDGFHVTRRDEAEAILASIHHMYASSLRIHQLGRVLQSQPPRRNEHLTGVLNPKP